MRKTWPHMRPPCTTRLYDWRGDRLKRADVKKIL